MKRNESTRCTIPALPSLALALAPSLALALPQPAYTQDLALQGGTVIDVSTGTARPATVLVRDGMIQAVSEGLAVPDGARVVDVSGRWIIPGLVEMHSHTVDSVALRMALALGITSTLTIYTEDAPLPPDWESPSNIPSNPVPRMYLVGGGFRVEVPFGELPERFRPTTPAEAEASLDFYRNGGVRRIKIWLDDATVQFDHVDRTFDDRMLAAIVSGARARGMEIYMHAATGELFRRAVAVGPTWLVHPMLTDDVTEADLDAMQAAGLGWTTTMSRYMWGADPRWFDRMVLADTRLVRTLPAERVAQLEAEAALAENPAASIRPRLIRRIEEYREHLRRNTMLAIERGLTFTIGSDHGAGYGTHVEIETLANAGFDPVTLLRAATLGGAQALGVSDRFGSVSAGKVADLVVLTSDPRIDVLNLRDVDLVLKGGHLWRASELLVR